MVLHQQRTEILLVGLLLLEVCHHLQEKIGVVFCLLPTSGIAIEVLLLIEVLHHLILEIAILLIGIGTTTVGDHGEVTPTEVDHEDHPFVVDLHLPTISFEGGDEEVVHHHHHVDETMGGLLFDLTKRNGNGSTNDVGNDWPGNPSSTNLQQLNSLLLMRQPWPWPIQLPQTLPVFRPIETFRPFLNRLGTPVDSTLATYPLTSPNKSCTSFSVLPFKRLW